MTNDQQDRKAQEAQKQGEQSGSEQKAQQPPAADVDGLADKKPEELTPEELRLMADTMPGEGPGD